MSSNNNYDEINRVYSPSKFFNEEELERSSRSSSRVRSAKSKSDRDSLLFSRTHTPESNTADESLDEYYPKSPIQQHNILSIINEKIAKLDEVLYDFRTMRTESQSSNNESIRPISSTKAKQVATKKEKENKEIHQFAGIYSMKSVFYDTKINIPAAYSAKDDALNNKPKLIELFQFPGFEKDNLTPLPHNIKINNVLEKTINSINILNKQLKYKQFVRKMMFCEEFKAMVHDVFWYIFLEKYQNNSHRTLQSLFERISKNYVTILFMTLDPYYKETFYTNFANLLSMTVYTTFTTCFPESYTHFGHDFKELICNICHLWINGNKPVPRSYIKWNFKMLDPPQALFAEEVLTNKNSMEQVLNFDNNNSGRLSELKLNDPSNSNASSRLNVSKSQTASNLSTNKKLVDFKTQPKKIKKESHVACKGPEFENSLFDLYGRSPLVDCFMYKQNARKLNTFETLITHPSIINLPPLNAPTYNDIIRDSLKVTKKLESDYKNTVNRQKKASIKLANEHSKAMRTFNENKEILLSKHKEVKYIGDLITMETKKDPKSTSVGADLALLKALKIE